ncbi:hypothetical protein [Pseudoalteromonas piscicida]|uniref:hypothetical protein n=1 Tax=Pseudoalteromonas piscicida TaxID=43662 RepID=UPI003C7ED49C
MLLNAVVVSVNQLLPVTVLWVLLAQCTNAALPLKTTLIALSAGLIGCFGIWFLGGEIASSFDYRGFELLQIGLLLSLFCLMIATKRTGRTALAALAFGLAVVLYLHHLASFAFSYSKPADGQTLAIGTSLGVGICLSFSILLFFFLDWLKSKHLPWLLLLLLALHGASKVSIALDLALQVDLISAARLEIDLRQIVDEHSVVGRVLRVLVGYEATPNAATLAGFGGALITFLGCTYWRTAHAK